MFVCLPGSNINNKIDLNDYSISIKQISWSDLKPGHLQISLRIHYPVSKTLKIEWQSTPVFLPGESHGQKGLAGYHPQGCKESDTTEMIQHSTT